MAEAPASCPRPLRLASVSIINSQASTASSVSRDTAGHNSVLGTTTGAEQIESEETHHTPSLYTPPSSARGKSHSSSRRHSSISYIHSGTTSPLQASFRPESVDVLMKSPLSETLSTSSQFPPVGHRSPYSKLSRNKSFSGPVARNAKDRRASNRTSNDSLLGDLKMGDAMKHLKERPPVTVAEKHAELLHFIAQKESKCSELRSQLAMHEAELLQLKHKWELIINRGFEKSQASSSFPTSSPNPPSFVSPAPASGPHAISRQTASLPYFPLLPGAHAPVLEGIKEGVQGMSRFIAAGFESIAAGSIESSRASHQPPVSLHQPPIPLLLGSSTSKVGRKPAKPHSQNESQSSSSTAASSSTFAPTDTSATSIRSFSFDGSASVTASQTSTQINERDVEDGRGSLEHCDVQSKSSTSVSDRSEQVLIVRDTGATPTMSPNPDFERKVRSKKVKEKQGGALTASFIKQTARNDPSLDDGWDELSPRLRGELQISKPSINRQANTSMAETPTRVRSSKSPPSLPPMSAIPGLATMNLAAPAAQQVSSWMGSVGKRLGEIRGSSTFTKNQKRASLLLSDIQNTFVSSLISATPASPFPSSPSTREKLPDPDPIFASNPLVSQPTSASLLDEFDGEISGHTDKTSVLLPSTRKSPAKREQPCQETKEGGSKESDDWNW